MTVPQRRLRLRFLSSLFELLSLDRLLVLVLLFAFLRFELSESPEEDRDGLAFARLVELDDRVPDRDPDPEERDPDLDVEDREAEGRELDELDEDLPRDEPEREELDFPYRLLPLDVP